MFIEIWEILIMITACWNVFWLPISIAFRASNETAELIDIIVDIFFVLDIILVFRTSIFDETGEEVLNRKKIARNYLKGKFTVDVLSAIPFDKVALFFLDAKKARNFSLLGILKLIRVLRLNKIIAYLNVQK